MNMFVLVYVYKICNYVNRTTHDIYIAIKSLNASLHFRN